MPLHFLRGASNGDTSMGIGGIGFARFFFCLVERGGWFGVVFADVTIDFFFVRGSWGKLVSLLVKIQERSKHINNR